MEKYIGKSVRVKYQTNDGERTANRVLKLSNNKQLSVNLNGHICYVEPVFLEEKPDEPIFFKGKYFELKR